MNRSWIASLSLITAVACGDADPTDEPNPDFFTSMFYVAPAGSNATVGVNTIVPTTVAPGEKRVVQIEMENTGTDPLTNDWTTNYYLFSRNTNWGWRNRRVTTVTPTGNSFTFSTVITAPTVGTAGAVELRTEMYSGEAPDTGYFGDVFSQNIVVDPAVVPSWRCNSTGNTLPASIEPGATQNVTITLQNTGTEAWPVNASFCLFARHAPSTLFGAATRCLRMPRAVPPSPAVDSTVDVTFEITAPNAIGTYDFQYQMFDGSGVQFFDDNNLCVDATLNVQVANPDPLNATITNPQVFPTVMAPGERREVTVTIQNTGADTWPDDGTFYLFSRTTPSYFWGQGNRPINQAVAPGGTVDVNILITAPAAPQLAEHRWQMFRSTEGYFGELTAVQVLVDGNTVPQYGATVVAQNLPVVLGVGAIGVFEITMQNTGTQDWNTRAFQLRSQNAPNNLWGPVASTLNNGETVAGDVNGNGANRVFSFAVMAPATPGNYTSSWRMLDPNGVGLFGDTAITQNIVVTDTCGNSQVQADIGETCDDGNFTNGDGCDSNCQIEPLTVDLANAAAGRTFHGPESFRMLGNVAIGDVDNDGVSEVLTASIESVVTTQGATVALAGAVHGYVGGENFFDGATTAIPAAADFTIVGEAGSQFGGSGASGLLIGDVTGDGVNDIVVSAYKELGPGSAVDAGAVYVIAGGGLSGRTVSVAGRDPTDDANVVAVIRSATADDRLFIAALGDLTGDTVDDIVIGIPGNDFNGNADVGGYAIIEGGVGLAGVRTITATGAAGIVHGAGNRVGAVAAVGDVNGDGSNDLVWGDPSFNTGGANRAGAVFAVQGPFTQTLGSARIFDAATTAPDHSITGAALNDRLGTAVEFGNVQGDNTLELMVAEKGHHVNGAGLQVGAVSVFTLPLPAATNLAGVNPFHRLIAGEFQRDSAATLALGDINNDGFADIPLITPLGDGLVDGGAGTGAGAGSGEAAFVLGGPGIVADGSRSLFQGGGLLPAPLQIFGPDAGGRMGIHVHSVDIGDIDGDGSADICIGSYRGGTGLGGLTQPGRIDCIQSIW